MMFVFTLQSTLDMNKNSYLGVLHGSACCIKLKILLLLKIHRLWLPVFIFKLNLQVQELLDFDILVILLFPSIHIMPCTPAKHAGEACMTSMLVMLVGLLVCACMAFGSCDRVCHVWSSNQNLNSVTNFVPGEILNVQRKTWMLVQTWLMKQIVEFQGEKLSLNLFWHVWTWIEC